MRSFSLLLTAFVFSCVEKFLGPSPIDAYIAKESVIAKAGILANIGPDGSKSSGALPGVVIASPNTVDPNYLYTWIRDASLTFKVITQKVVSGEDLSLRGKIDQFFLSQKHIQQLPNPSGPAYTGGLGEPKFNINETAFTGPWGRPQRDGPALRATTFILYANWLIQNGNSTWVTQNLWPVIKLDLDYVQNYWNRTTIDLWEETGSSSFFTTAVQHRALRQGIALAATLGEYDTAFGYLADASRLLCFLQTYKNTVGGYFTANTGGGRSGIDSNTILASIHVFDPAAGCDATTFQPCSDIALSNLKVYVDSFRKIYPINNGAPPNRAVATGRYPEDVYFGGNPWYLSTFAVAEQLYDALIVWEKRQEITVTATSLTFFRQFISGLATGSYAASTSTYSTLTTAIRDFADGFVLINAQYTPSDGGLAEQFTRNNGSPLSAKDLTWSYASALTAFAARDGYVPPTWGAAGLVVPFVCSSNPGPTASVTFNVQATTSFGENVFLVGSVPELGNWLPDHAIPLSSDHYPTWSATVTLPGFTPVQYKYIKKDGDKVTWTPTGAGGLPILVALPSTTTGGNVVRHDVGSVPFSLGGDAYMYSLSPKCKLNSTQRTFFPETVTSGGRRLPKRSLSHEASRPSSVPMQVLPIDVAYQNGVQPIQMRARENPSRRPDRRASQRKKTDEAESGMLTRAQPCSHLIVCPHAHASHASLSHRDVDERARCKPRASMGRIVGGRVPDGRLWNRGVVGTLLRRPSYSSKDLNRG